MNLPQYLIDSWVALSACYGKPTFPYQNILSWQRAHWNYCADCRQAREDGYRGQLPHVANNKVIDWQQ